MDFDISFIVTSLIFSAIGFVYFSYGRKQAEVKLIATGLALMVYPYFLDSFGLVLGLGVAIAALPFLLGWW